MSLFPNSIKILEEYHDKIVEILIEEVASELLPEEKEDDAHVRLCCEQVAAEMMEDAITSATNKIWESTQPEIEDPKDTE
jgi:hypothetical protein